MDFLQFLRYFTPQAELEEAFIYITHKADERSDGTRLQKLQSLPNACQLSDIPQ